MRASVSLDWMAATSYPVPSQKKASFDRLRPSGTTTTTAALGEKSDDFVKSEQRRSRESAKSGRVSKGGWLRNGTGEQVSIGLYPSSAAAAAAVVAAAAAVAARRRGKVLSR